MESLYTKYRPQTFEQVVGQSHVVETLKRAVLEGRTSHAYLFCGPRGTGKTTMARILAKALMCEKGPAALPDGSCEQCRLIASGEHPDVIELDAASRTGVDNVREEIIGRVSYAPVMGRAKVYIIDEVHMLTPAAFNALLKTLEEPPEHVVFVMCTTDPQKILPTILSRVQRFDFHAIGNDEMQAHLAYVCGQEGFTYDAAALELIVRHARGGMRDALTSLEQLSVFGAGDIGLEATQDLLGEVSGSVLGKVAEEMARRDAAALFAEVATLADEGRDLLRFTRELAAHVRDVYVVAVAPDADDVVAARGEELAALRAEAAAFGSADRVARVLTILGDASSEMRTATNQRLVLEIALTRVARPETDLTLEALAERVGDLERQVAILATPGARPAAAAPEPQPAAPAPRTQTQNGFGFTTQAPASTDVDVPAAQSVAAEVAPQPAPAPTPVSEPKPSSAGEKPGGSGSASAPAGLSNGNLQRTWKQVVDQLVRQVPAKGSLLLSSTAVSDDGSRLTVSLPKGSHFAARMLERSDVRASVDPVVAAAFGPRQVVYVESSLASQAISRAEAQAQPAPVPVAPPVEAPAPAPVSAPVSIDSRTQVENAGVSGAERQENRQYSAPEAEATEKSVAPEPAYPMPWDAPAPEPVPYTDADVASFAQDEEPPVNEPPVVTAPEPTPMPAASSELPARGQGGDVSPIATREASEPRSGERGADGGDVAPLAGGEELSPEFAAIAAQLSAAFGQPLSVSVEPSNPTSDEEAAAELSRERDYEEDAGFTDEPVDDEEDDE